MVMQDKVESVDLLDLVPSRADFDSLIETALVYNCSFL